MRGEARPPYAEKSGAGAWCGAVGPKTAGGRWQIEVTRVTPAGGTTVQDHVALAEIELCGELIIAASAAVEERLSLDRIDEVLLGR
ncbi:hypothetical protein GCM10010343_63790 [Streptomyces avidinii]|nr:hypothetical protein GCM10010343_63790 [Streptomyces avidinii]